MKSPIYVKEVQMLNGCLAALNRFISQFTDKCKRFFQVLKKNMSDFCWNKQLSKVWWDIWFHHHSCPSPPQEKCYSFIWLSWSQPWVKPWFMKMKASRSRYTTSVIPWTNYKPDTKGWKSWCSRKHYFQTFLITVLMEHSLRSIIENPKVTG